MEDLITVLLIMSPCLIYCSLICCALIVISWWDKRRGTPGRIEKMIEEWWNELVVPTQTFLVAIPFISLLMLGAAIGTTGGARSAFTLFFIIVCVPLLILTIVATIHDTLRWYLPKMRMRKRFSARTRHK